MSCHVCNKVRTPNSKLDINSLDSKFFARFCFLFFNEMYHFSLTYLQVKHDQVLFFLQMRLPALEELTMIFLEGVRSGLVC